MTKCLERSFSIPWLTCRWKCCKWFKSDYIRKNNFGQHGPSRLFWMFSHVYMGTCIHIIWWIEYVRSIACTCNGKLFSLKSTQAFCALWREPKYTLFIELNFDVRCLLSVDYAELQACKWHRRSTNPPIDLDIHPRHAIYHYSFIGHWAGQIITSCTAHAKFQVE